MLPFCCCWSLAARFLFTVQPPLPLLLADLHCCDHAEDGVLVVGRGDANVVQLRLGREHKEHLHVHVFLLEAAHVLPEAAPTQQRSEPVSLATATARIGPTRLVLRQRPDGLLLLLLLLLLLYLLLKVVEIWLRQKLAETRLRQDLAGKRRRVVRRRKHSHTGGHTQRLLLWG